MDGMESLMKKEIPEMREGLLETRERLSQVADYCVDNYKNSNKSKQEVVQETKDLTTRALAAVAFQVFYYIIKILFCFLFYFQLI